MALTTVRPASTLPDVFLIERPTFGDDRGFFREYLRLNDLEAAVGRSLIFVQANHSRSKQRVLRGIHVADYDKLIYVPAGVVLAVLVDLRPSSATWLKHEVLRLGEGNPLTVYLPPGIGNSYYVETETADYLYLVTASYDPAREQTVRWDDPDLNLPWPDPAPIVSERDRERAQTVRELFPAAFGNPPP